MVEAALIETTFVVIFNILKFSGFQVMPIIAIEIAIRYIISNLLDLFISISAEIKPYCFDKCNPEIEKNRVISAVYDAIIRFERLTIKFEFKIAMLKKLVKYT
ncbi:MAG: hypothetical protein DRJ36_03205, partial [Thermoprotei archaeon]